MIVLYNKLQVYCKILAWNHIKIQLQTNDKTAKMLHKPEFDLKGDYSNEHSDNITGKTWKRDRAGFQ